MLNKKIIAGLLSSACLLFNTVAQAQKFANTTEEYDISDALISTAHLRSRYYTENTFFNSSHDADEFLKIADREKPVVVYLHGCAGNGKNEVDLKRFYVDNGMNFIMTDFLSRGDAKASCTVANGRITLHSNFFTRIPARVLEFNDHVKWLRENGFKHIIGAGHSEGATTVAMVEEPVDAMIMHSSVCPPGYRQLKTNNPVLQFISFNDPFFDNIPFKECLGERFTVVTSTVSSHAPFADPTTKEVVLKYLAKQREQWAEKVQ